MVHFSGEYALKLPTGLTSYEAPQTSFAVDVMYYSMAARALDQAIQSKPRVDELEREMAYEKEMASFTDKEAMEGEISWSDAYDREESRAISMVDSLHPEIEKAYKPFVESLSLVYILCCAALEAHINQRAQQLLSGRWLDQFDKLSLEGKWLFLPKMASIDGFIPGSQPFQGFMKLLSTRNKMVHFKMKTTENWSLGAIPSAIGKLGLSVEDGRDALDASRGMIGALAAQLKEPTQDWLDREPNSYFLFL